jgi:hypothetical protein
MYDAGVRSGEQSRMADYSDVMTIRQLADIIAYVESLGS